MIIKIIRQENCSIIFYDELGAAMGFSIEELIEMLNKLKEVDER